MRTAKGAGAKDPPERRDCDSSRPPIRTAALPAAPVLLPRAGALELP